MKHPSERRLPLQQAFRQYADPVLLARLDELEPYANEYTDGVTEHLFHEHAALEEHLGEALIKRLKQGELVARALVLGGPVSQGFVPIPPERWARLEINHETFEVWGPNHLVLAEVEIREAEPDADAIHDDANAPGRDRLQRPPAASSGEPPALLWEEGRVLTIRGQRMVFQGPVQQAIIDQLAKAYSKGQWLRTETILTHAGSQSDTLAKAFSGSPNWTTLKRFLHKRSGYCRLEV